MNIPQATLLSSAALALVATGAAPAATLPQPGAPHAPVITLQYQSGGETASSRARLDRDANVNGYDLRLHMPHAALDGSWGDVEVAVTDARGTPVLSAHAGGPLFYARLPAGEYTVAVKNGSRETVIHDVKLAPGAPASVDADLGA